MPKRTDIHSILLIGSGPIVIGQACEFDYSGTQACRVLRDQGYKVILANSNPATIMTDPEFADRTYVEPLEVDFLAAIIERERPDAVLPTLGGQTALNLAMQLVERGVLDRFGVELIGASADAIRHAGDSITVAPAQTLSDVEYQQMRDAAFLCIRRIGVETGGSNIQFAIDPTNGRMVVIEMNPRVSRSSALASKATGFPIAKIAARLAVGMSLDEIPNDITKKTPACFEPTIDYVVLKIPKWQFVKYPGPDSTLGTQLTSVGQVMAIGRTFKEALQKGIRSLEPSSPWRAPADTPVSLLREKIATARPDRIHWLLVALERGISSKEMAELTKIDPWFIQQMQEIVAVNKRLASVTIETVPVDLLREAKRMGTSDEQLARLWQTTPAAVW